MLCNFRAGRALGALCLAAIGLTTVPVPVDSQTNGGRFSVFTGRDVFGGPRGGGGSDNFQSRTTPPPRVIIEVPPPRIVTNPPPRRVVTNPPPRVVTNPPPRKSTPPPRVVSNPPPRNTAPPPAPVPVNLPDFAPDEIITLDLGADDLATLIGQGFEVIEVAVIAGLGLTSHRLRKPQALTLVAARDAVRALPTGGSADFNHYYRALQGISPCEGIQCAERTLVGWPAVTARETACGSGALIGMIDSGINDRHETFAGARLELVKLPADPEDPSQAVHGTAVAALLVGDPASRSPGLVPGARLVAVDAFYRNGSDERTDTFTLLEALGILADQGVGVMNLSLAGPDNSALAAVIGLLTLEMDIVVVAAVGNSGPDAAPEYPAAYPPVVAVTAVDRAGTLYDRAVRGDHVDIAAPGVEVWTAASIKGARWKTGTSFAVPFVSATAAILRTAHPEMSATDISGALRAQARDMGAPGPDREYGAGLLNLGGLCAP